jgi:outer membrane protein TolC
VAFTDVHGNTYVVAGNIHWDIFDAGAHYRRLQQAKSEVREATDKLDSMRLVAEQEVWSAYTGVTTALAEQDAAQASLDAATESFHVTETAYANGTKQLLDLEQSQSELAKADSAYQTARAQTLMLAAQLAFSTGDLLETGSKLPSAGSGPSQNVK